MRLYLYTALLLLSYTGLSAQACATDQRTVDISLLTDYWGYEIAWSLTTLDGTIIGQALPDSLANSSLYNYRFCVDTMSCMTFEITDTYGNGVFESGYFTLAVDGDTIADNPRFRSAWFAHFDCTEGQVCETATPVTTGSYTTTYDDHWYVFTPDSVGTYLVSTCGLDTCDTKIWIYDTCDDLTAAEDNRGVILFDDNDSECAPQAAVEGYLTPGLPYYIRIGDNMDRCGDSIRWRITYLGPVVGCTDPTSCSYDPLATVDDGSCIPQGSPDCPNGPDLVISQLELANSLILSTIENNDPCLIEEGCVTGYGTRDVLRFDTRIDNIGTTDYYIGIPDDESDQFTWNNCHRHFHYDGYAEYLLFSQAGQQLPSSFKNGFCVIDLGCTTGSGQYNCGNMGLTTGCYDRYWAGLECQWIDITTVPDGAYYFVTRVNWDNAPDALGRIEKDTINNWAQVCFDIDRSSGELVVNFDTECEPFVDCAGVPFGNTQPDCAGECGGSAVLGDLNNDQVQNMADAEKYVATIIAGDAPVTPCSDLNKDDRITVYDAALLSDCQNFGRSHVHEGVTIHNHCNLPGGIINELDTVAFSIIDYSLAEGYVDIGIKNPNSQVVAYQFTLSGIQLSSVVNLVDANRYPIAPLGSLIDQTVVGISYQDSTIERSAAVQPLCRVYFSEVTDGTICIAQATEAVNALYEQTVPVIEGDCIAVVGVAQRFNTIKVEAQPNPFTNFTRLTFPNPSGSALQLSLYDSRGRIVRTYSAIRTNVLDIARATLPAGLYFYRLSGEHVRANGRLVVQ